MRVVANPVSNIFAQQALDISRRSNPAAESTELMNHHLAANAHSTPSNTPTHDPNCATPYPQHRFTPSIGPKYLNAMAADPNAKPSPQRVYRFSLYVKKRADISEEEFSRHWRESHAPLVGEWLKRYGILRYVQVS